ncbi:unnamed protein product [Mytilus coruscus]|uniref:Uncharacterized protein n=1 Tax=Mytilus coruscus TaxID=42192 RepID=A0A6J7ZVL1_MYTCO|nr:unnamed protein product [Mytilus coruscus]
MATHPEAWWRVAQNEKENKTGLSWEIAKELRDRQRNSFAQTTFSESVQREMEINGDFEAARTEWLLDMKQYMLPNLKVGHFPPPGSYIASLLIAQFEGILSNIDRRLQLYNMTKNGTYNQRSISSLDSETFFSAFQPVKQKTPKRKSGTISSFGEPSKGAEGADPIINQMRKTFFHIGETD